MTVRVAADVLREWRKQRAEGLEPAITMRLAAKGSADATRGVLNAVLDAVVEQRRSDEEPWRGEWSSVRSGRYVVVTVLECEVLDEVLPAIAAGLEERGVDGAIDLFVAERGAPRWPAPAPYIEARIRTRGHREHIGGRTYAWRPDADSVRRVADLASEWCMGEGSSSAWLMTAFNPAVEMPRDEVAERFRAALPDTGPLQIRTARRGVAVEAFEGRFALMAPATRWPRTLAPIVDVLRRAADAAAYGFVKTGSSMGYAIPGESLRFDWPPRADVAPGARLGNAFEDELAPDAFAIQLLGPGYRDRIPETALYRREELADACLLEHVDLPAWFDEPFVPYDTQWPQLSSVTPPPVLRAAREALAPVLFRDVP